MKKDLEIKLTVYQNQRIVIENYRQLLDLNEEIIRVDIYEIIGKFLKLTRMDNYMIEVIGTIDQVVIAG
ncbi:MAG: YabP/YqfC family sporulation protein [Bacilli bacterium]|nr:YabP/YqfC family sporulation protein [Bacilli bacterium]